MSPAINPGDDYFTLFDLPRQFTVDRALLSDRYRALQTQMHPDRYANASAHEQRLAIQYSAQINEAYETLRRPLERALYLLQLAGIGGEEVARKEIDGGFLMMQMELREKLEEIPGLVDSYEAVEHLLDEIDGDLKAQQKDFAAAYSAEDFAGAATACVKMQYLDKLLREAEQLEARLMDD